MKLETERLLLRELNEDDFPSLCDIIQDDDTMYAYEGALSDAEAKEWLVRQIGRYKKYGFGPLAVILKDTGKLIGQIGLSMQKWKDREMLEIGYLLNKDYWHNGFATEAALLCKNYAFNVLKANEVCSIIRDSNVASQNVAKRVGMAKVDEWVKHYRGVNMPHFLYLVHL